MRQRSILVLTVAIAVAMAGTVLAEPAPQKARGYERLAKERLEGDRFQLELSTAYERATVTLRGPRNLKLERTFKAGQPISFALEGKDGSALADGTYRYMLRVRPRPENGSPVHAGLFFVENGRLVSREAKRAELAETRQGLQQARKRSAQATVSQRPSAARQTSEDAVSRPAPDPSAAATGGFLEIYGASVYIYPYGYYYYSPTLYFTSYYYPYRGQTYIQEYYGNLISYAWWFNVQNGWQNVEDGLTMFRTHNYYDFRYAPDIYDAGGYINLVATPFYDYYYYNYYGGYIHLASQEYYYPYGYQTLSQLNVTPTGVGVGTYYPADPFHVYNGSLRVERGDGDTPNIRFSSIDAGQKWLFQLNYSSGIFSIRDETGGASPFRIKPGAPAKALDIENDGRLTTSTGAFLSSGGVWTDASSRELKEDIQDLPLEEALAVLAELDPVKFKYRGVDERHVGFIAEDVPELVAVAERNGLSAMDIVAVLTEVLQHQQQEILTLNERLAKLEESSSKP